MLRILVDTCVWHYWFCHGVSPTPEIERHCRAFQRIYDLVSSNQDRIRFLYNQRIKDELGSNFASDFYAKIIPLSDKIPIPLSRWDVGYHFDSGDLILGGEMGGSLRELLPESGYPYDKELKRALASWYEKDFSKATRRKREFDIEHMESALEARADLFITTDEKTILNMLAREAPKFGEDHAVNMIFRITKRPTDALSQVEDYLNTA